MNDSKLTSKTSVSFIIQKVHYSVIQNSQKVLNIAYHMVDIICHSMLQVAIQP